MAEPTTQNIALIIPNTGDLPGAWGPGAINPDFVALDGMLGGVATVGLTNVDVTLTAPSGAVTPGAGPNQAQNAVLRFTGVLTGNVTVTLPLPGFTTIENLTSGNFVVSFRAVAVGEVIATPQGSIMRVYNDGTNVRFVGDVSLRPGKMEFEGGEIGLPAWIAACTVKPYLVADGTVHPVADAPFLARKYGSKFGGDGVTTFGMPDLGGRIPLPYDYTGTRITVAGAGINGQTLGAAGGTQDHILSVGELASHTHTFNGAALPGHSHQVNCADADPAGIPNGGGGNSTPTNRVHTTDSVSAGTPAGTNANTGSGLAHINTQPSQVVGVWLVKT
jgi:microcystin-dependent protein